MIVFIIGNEKRCGSETVGNEDSWQSAVEDKTQLAMKTVGSLLSAECCVLSAEGREESWQWAVGSGQLAIEDKKVGNEIKRACFRIVLVIC